MHNFADDTLLITTSRAEARGGDTVKELATCRCLEALKLSKCQMRVHNARGNDGQPKVEIHDSALLLDPGEKGGS
jgi:hypothetical protein